MTVEEFNALHPVGTRVVIYPGIRPEHPAGGWRCKHLETTTRTPAWLLGGHTPVVMVEGYATCLALTHVDVLSGGAS
jgi:hypothetical protein